MNRIERNKYFAHVGIVYSDVQIWGQYDRLIDFIYEEFPKLGRNFEEIAFPILSILSHTLELALKENIKFFKEYHGSEHLAKFENWTMLLKSHELKDLASEFKAGYIKLHKQVGASEQDKKEFLTYYKQLEELIKILDRSTETYRYTFKLDKNGEKIKKGIPNLKIIDFYKLKKLFEDAKIFLLGVSNSLAVYTDYIDYIKKNPAYLKRGKGYLYCPRLDYSKEVLEQVKEQLTERFTCLPNGIWLNQRTGENFEIQICDKDIYIIAIKNN